MTWSSDGRFIVACNRPPLGQRLVGLMVIAVAGGHDRVQPIPHLADEIVAASRSPVDRWLD